MLFVSGKMLATVPRNMKAAITFCCGLEKLLPLQHQKCASCIFGISRRDDEAFKQLLKKTYFLSVFFLIFGI